MVSGVAKVEMEGKWREREGDRDWKKMPLTPLSLSVHADGVVGGHNLFLCQTLELVLSHSCTAS